ncbi:MAG TPA: hypothetical protein VIK89_01910 [Cytophagaceae bacterium]
MSFGKLIQSIISQQEETRKSVPVDLTLKNGNILLRSFKIREFDAENEVLTGITLQEEYVHVREGREPVLCSFKLSELKDLEVADWRIVTTDAEVICMA